jgi:hypothetical protein
MLILIDTQYDPLLYSAGAGRRGVDMLCENALASALALAAPEGPSGAAPLETDILIGFTGGTGCTGGTPADLAAALAWPAALPLSAAAELPAAPEDRGVLIFARPRASAESSSLDRFLRNHANRAAAFSVAGQNKVQTVELIFLYGVEDANDIENAAASGNAAQTCAALYNRRPGVRARTLQAGNREQRTR